MKNLTSKKNNDKIDEQYSRDADQTRFLWMAFVLALTTLSGLFILEFFHPVDSPIFFTAEINHILVNGCLIGFFSIGAYIYGKNTGANEALVKMAGGGNGTDKKETEQQKKETPN